jgi:NAD(P)-dependent dehydrogenase (short-subunit alcohol dehydrogenase family)
MENFMKGFSLEGKTAMVTGGGGGMGSTACLAFAEAGADLVIADLNIEEAEKISEKVRANYGRKTITVKCDVSNPADVNNLGGKIRKNFKRLDVAFNNAGIAFTENAEDVTYEQWQRCIGINLTGVFLTAQMAGRIMLAQGSGSIINTASMSGHIVNVPQKHCMYNTSKAGVIQLTKSLAVEWGPRGVRVNSISPGYINTVLSNSSSPWYNEWLQYSVMKRIGETSELAGILIYLASDLSSFTNGADIVIDGGYTIR